MDRTLRGRRARFAVIEDFEKRLRRCADVVVRAGLGLRPGQRVLVTDPFELQGVPRGAARWVEAVTEAAAAAGAREVGVIWADEARMRRAAARWPDQEFDDVLARNTARMLDHVDGGDALLFLHGHRPGLMAGLPADRVGAWRDRCWQHYGQVAQHLVTGRTNWTVAPAPDAGWADAVLPMAAPRMREALLWLIMFEALRADTVDPLAAWREHLADLERVRKALGASTGRRRLRFVGPGTNLEVELPAGHRWATACMRTPGGQAFVANLPTEEVFTAPDRDSVAGRLVVARPVAYGGMTIEGIELEFERGLVVRARARKGAELLSRVLATDEGARRLGEVAVVPRVKSWARSGLCFHHPLLDENAMSHVALGDAYGFTATGRARARINHSLVHLDLPIDADVAE